MNINMWSPGEVAFTMKRLIIQKHFSGEEEEEEEEMCMICLESLERRMAIYLPCKHVFHYKCWQQLIERWTYTCPLCRENFSEALPVVGIPVVEPPGAGAGADTGADTGANAENMVILTIFTDMDLYDFMLEFLLRSYEREAILEDEADIDL